MARLLVLLGKVPLMVYLVVGGLALGATWLAINNAHQRELGKLAAEQAIRQATSDSATKVLVQRNQQLDALVGRFNAKVAQVTAAKARTDAASVGLRSARDALAQEVADSLATIQALRDKGTSLIAASDAAEKAHVAERATSDAALTAAKRATTFAVDSVKAASMGALSAAIARAVAAETIVKVRTGWRANLLSRCGLSAGYSGVLSGGSVRAGPGVMVGCRLLP